MRLAGGRNLFNRDPSKSVIQKNLSLVAYLPNKRTIIEWSYNMFSHNQQTISDLRDDLDQTRQVVISLMSQEIREILRSYTRCESRRDADCWRYDVVGEIIQRAEILPEEISHFSERAYCPLCGEGSSWQDDHGFSIPEGLRRHLLGNRCSIFRVALVLARQTWNKNFHAKEEGEARAAHTQKVKRKKSETLYRTTRCGPAELIDEGIGAATARKGCDLPWAENRLLHLGFEIVNDGKVKSYIYELDDLIVYADPRVEGEIKFAVYLKPASNRSRNGLRQASTVSWKSFHEYSQLQSTTGSTSRIPAARSGS